MDHAIRRERGTTGHSVGDAAGVPITAAFLQPSSAIA
jgi:hypothetical protein